MKNNAKRLLGSCLNFLPSLVIDNIVDHLISSCESRYDWLFEDYPSDRRAVMRTLYRELSENVFDKVCVHFIDKGCKFLPVKGLPDWRGFEVAAEKYLDLDLDIDLD